MSAALSATASAPSGAVPSAAEVPGRRPLYRAWAVLAALTVLSVATRLKGGSEGVGATANLIILAASFIKARQVLDHFLGLKGAALGWRTGLSLMLLAILAGVGAMAMA